MTGFLKDEKLYDINVEAAVHDAFQMSLNAHS